MAPTRLWNESDTLGDLDTVVRAFHARLRERLAHWRAPLTRTQGAVANAAQSTDAQLGPVDADPDRLHGHTVLHSHDRTGVVLPCLGDCGRAMRFPSRGAAFPWMCAACLGRTPGPPVLRLIKGGKDD